MGTTTARPALDLRRAQDLVVPRGVFDMRWLTAIPSTQEEVKRSGAGALRVVGAEEQLAGRGRAGRTWTCPAGAGLMFSVGQPAAGLPAERASWIGAVLGLAVVRALAGLSVLPAAGLKWPNDVLIGEDKVGGILAERDGSMLIVGIGLNVSLTAGELPRPDATSLHLAGARQVDRERLLADILGHYFSLSTRWLAADGDVQASGLRREYLDCCTTLGRRVVLYLPGDTTVTGTVVDVNAAGHLVLRSTAGQDLSHAAGDVVHLRSAEG